MIVRQYETRDYPAIKALYKDSSTFGGQFDEARDGAAKLEKLVSEKPDSILIAEEDGKVVGTVTLFEDGRSAWLYRFAIANGQPDSVAGMLYARAVEVLKARGHTQVLVYAPAGDKGFEARYVQLRFNKGSDFTAYWKDL